MTPTTEAPSFPTAAGGRAAAMAALLIPLLAGPLPAPNEMEGPPGFGVDGVVPIDAELNFRIYFENLGEVPVQLLVIESILDPDLDWSTFRHHEVDLDPPPLPELPVKLETELDLGTGRVVWRIEAITEDIIEGFLAPEGEGSVAFSLLPRQGLEAGTIIESSARISFDALPPILTNTFTNRVGSPGKRPFYRADSNASEEVDIADAVFSLGSLFVGGDDPPCRKSMDANDDGRLDVSDPVFVLQSLFQGGPLPPEPWSSCGLDPTPDLLSCDSFPPCGN